jgi:hypothetical protein
MRQIRLDANSGQARPVKNKLAKIRAGRATFPPSDGSLGM